MPRNNNNNNNRATVAQNFLEAVFGGRRGSNRAVQRLLTAALEGSGHRNGGSGNRQNNGRRDSRADTTAETPEERALRLRAEADEKVAYLEAKEGLLRRLRAMPEGEDRESFKKDLRGLNIWIKGLEILQPATDS